MSSLTWDQVCARRLARSSLTERSTDVVAVARAVGGIHAQVQASAELQLAARVDGIEQRDVRDALWRDRTLVKATTVRGTYHLHPADELALWLAARRAIGVGAPAGLEAWPDPKGVVHPPVTAEEVARIRAAVWDALDGRTLLREELATEVVRRVGPRHEARLRSGFAFFTGGLCQGPPQGNRVTFARPDQWVRGWRDVDERDALREAARRFLYAYGPARPAGFRSWFGPLDFRELDVDQVDVEGRRAFVLAGDMDFPEPQRTLRLLPEYDAYVMGFRERDKLVPERVRERVAAQGRAHYEGPAGIRFLLVDGIAAGVWERKKSSRRIEIRIAPVGRFRRAELVREVERIAAFLGVEPVLTIE